MVEKRAKLNEMKNTRTPTKPVLDVPEGDSSDDNMSAQAKKRRGRKRERDDKYFDKATAKIEEIKAKLKTAKKDGISVRERQRLRNQISAQQSRIRKKEEVIFLNKVTREKDQKFIDMLNYMVNNFGSAELLKMHKNLATKWEGLQQVDLLTRQREVSGQKSLSGMIAPKMIRANSRTRDRMMSSFEDTTGTSGLSEKFILERISASLLDNFTTKQEEFD